MPNIAFSLAVVAAIFIMDVLELAWTAGASRGESVAPATTPGW